VVAINDPVEGERAGNQIARRSCRREGVGGRDQRHNRYGGAAGRTTRWSRRKAVVGGSDQCPSRREGAAKSIDALELLRSRGGLQRSTTESRGKRGKANDARELLQRRCGWLQSLALSLWGHSKLWVAVINGPVDVGARQVERRAGAATM
jgi:hypothetical protein